MAGILAGTESRHFHSGLAGGTEYTGHSSRYRNGIDNYQIYTIAYHEAISTHGDKLMEPGEYPYHIYAWSGQDQHREACCSGDELKISEMHIFLEIPRLMWSA
jgi:hypothetical protein